MTEQIVFPAFGGGADISSWSGTPYFMLRAASAVDLPLVGVAVPAPQDMQVVRWLWRAWRLATLRKAAGFTMSETCLSRTWDDARKFPAGTRVLSYFSLLSTRMLDRVERGEIELNYYIDMTYKEFIDQYPEGRNADPALTERSFERERRGYRLAKRICSFTRSSADYICREYGIAPEKVKVVRGGANIEAALLEDEPASPRPTSPPFIIGFVGMDWKRKGLPLLATVLPRLRAAGHDVRLRVIGAAPPEISAMEGVEFIGRVDKTREMARYVALLRECSIGALLSDSEAMGMAGLEFLSVGVPVIGTAVGGLPDYITSDVGVLVPGGVSPDVLEQAIASLIDDPMRLQALADAAFRRRSEYHWSASMRQMRAVLNGHA